MIERLIWVVPVSVAALGLWRPRAGLVALAASLPLFGSSTGGPYLGALEMTALAAVVAGWRGGRPEPSALAPAAAAFVAVSLLSLIPSPYAPPSWRPEVLLQLARAFPGAQGWSALFGWRMAADLVIGFGLFLAVRRAFAGRSVRPLALALLAGLTANLLLGIAARAELIDLLAYRPRVFLWETVDTRLRGLFFASTRMAEYLVIAAPFGLLALPGRARWARRLLAPLAALVLAGLVLTLQRGGWIAAAAQTAFLAAVWWRWHRGEAVLRRSAVIAAATLVLVVAAFTVGGGSAELVQERVSDFGAGLRTRAPLWAAAVEMVGQRPALGQGLGMFAPAYDHLQEAGLAEAQPFRVSGHQLYLQLAAERGLIGLLSLGLLAAAAIYCLLRPRPGDEALALGLAASLLGVAVYGLVQNLFQLRVNGWLIWIVLGCVPLVTRATNPPAFKRAAWALVAAALLVVPFRVAAGRPAFAGDREFGFHEAEIGKQGTQQWTEGVAVRWVPCPPSSASRPAPRRTLVLELANGHPLGARRPVTVVVGVNGRTLSTLRISRGWEEHRLPLGPEVEDGLLLRLAVSPTFRPFSDYRQHPELPPARDHRLLGVAMRRASCE